MGSEDFRDRVARISQAEGENAWAMPLPDELKDDLKSSVADLANVSSQRFAGMLVAGVYLREFVADGVQWAHIDIAGPAYNTSGPWGLHAEGRHRGTHADDVRRVGGHRRQRLDHAGAGDAAHTLRQDLGRAVQQVGLGRDGPNRLVLLDRRDDRLGDLVRAVARRWNIVSSCARRVATAARLPDGAISGGVVDTMLVLMMPGGQIVVNPIPAEDNSARRQSENMYTAALDVQ